jgi:GTP1/Obg family GTP-binding protein
MRFIQPLPLPALIILVALLTPLIAYATIFWLRRKRVLSLRRRYSVMIFGLPNSGKTTLAKWLCGTSLTVSDFLDRISYGVANLAGRKIMVYDVNLFEAYGELNSLASKSAALLNPKIGLAVVDLSRFSAPLDKQLEFLSQAASLFKFEKQIYIARKLDRSSREKLRVLKERVGSFYKVDERDVEKFKKQLAEELEKLLT